MDWINPKIYRIHSCFCHNEISGALIPRGDFKKLFFSKPILIARDKIAQDRT